MKREEDASSSKAPRRRSLSESVAAWSGSWLGSAAIHLTIFFALFLLIRAEGRSGSSGERKADEVGIVLADDHQYESEEETTATDRSSETAGVASEAPREESVETSDSSLADMLPNSEIGVSDGGVARAMETNDNSSLSSPASGQRVGFGDASGSGRKFLYVIDRSDSMNWGGGGPMRRAIADAVESVTSLDPKRGATHFQIIAFNHEYEVWERNKNLVAVSPATKARALKYLNSLTATGGTAPTQALEAALKRRPDVVFFLTDADEELSELDLERARTLRRQYGVKQICVVEFGRASDSKKTSFRRLASENGGVYVFKDVGAFD